MPNSNSSKKKGASIFGQAYSYAKNVAKEYSQWDKNPNSDANVGQFYGALLQGRRYDDKTGKQIKAPAKGVQRLKTIPGRAVLKAKPMPKKTAKKK